MGTFGRKLGARPVSPLQTLPGLILFGVLLFALVGGYFLYRWWTAGGARTVQLQTFLQDPAAHSDWMMHSQSRCPGTPFAFPTDGYIGYLWGDTFQLLHPHSGIDVFGGGAIGQTPVYSASDGFLTRLADWKSAVIVRVPDDPLHPGRQIWLYYTHMANPEGVSFIAPEFMPGAMEKPVKAGQLLGYQGNYSGDPANPTGVHLHLSIVLDDGRGNFLNETDIRNTLDPSPYFGMELNAAKAKSSPPRCSS